MPRGVAVAVELMLLAWRSSVWLTCRARYTVCVGGWVTRKAPQRMGGGSSSLPSLPFRFLSFPSLMLLLFWPLLLLPRFSTNLPLQPLNIFNKTLFQV